MNRFSRDSDDQYVKKRNENDSNFDRRYEQYDTLIQPRTDNRLPSQQNYDRNSRNSYDTHTRQRPHDDHTTSDRKFRNSLYEEERERIDVPYKTQNRIIGDNNQDVNRRSNPPDQTQRSPKVDYTVNQRPSGNPRSCAIEINISINYGHGRNPQIISSTNNIPSRPLPIRSTAIIEDVGYVDLDIRSLERTARLATDGLVRSPPLKQQSTTNK